MQQNSKVERRQKPLLGPPLDSILWRPRTFPAPRVASASRTHSPPVRSTAGNLINHKLAAGPSRRRDSSILAWKAGGPSPRGEDGVTRHREPPRREHSARSKLVPIQTRLRVLCKTLRMPRCHATGHPRIERRSRRHDAALHPARTQCERSLRDRFKKSGSAGRNARASPHSPSECTGTQLLRVPGMTGMTSTG